MKKLLLILVLCLGFGVNAYAATEYLRVAGSDANCNGTVDVDDSVPVRPNCANATFNGAAADATDVD